MTTTNGTRYSMRKVGNKFDFIPRYSVVDKTTGKRVDRMPGGLVEGEAQELVWDLNGMVYECPTCWERHDGMTSGTEYCNDECAAEDED